MNAIWLIAGREFRAYVATASFWVALLIGPALAMGAAALSNERLQPPRPAVMVLAPVKNGGGLAAQFSDSFPASKATQAELVRVLNADHELGRPLRLVPPPPPSAPADPQLLSRFVLSAALFITLTGSLGMLLQAVVRERANRALETLLAAVRPEHIVAGKVIGVGGVSALVLASWVGSGVLAADSAGGGLLAAFSDPLTIMGGLGLFALAFAFYGFVTVAIGARARDSADAQNLARPMFAVLLAVFFATLAEAFGTRSLDGLVYVPPFTPFLLLMRPLGLAGEIGAVSALALGSVAAGWVAARSVRI